MTCDWEAMAKGGRASCPTWTDTSVSLADVPGQMLAQLTHPGLTTWPQRAAVGVWLAIAILIVSIIRKVSSRV